ncbi:polymorphic toxin-type HINT domain-containing protein [Planctopirus hydrillae]|nr:polymorphic toxin-type HINT domain-containing protein [Planctopirus hydrillae]
MKFFLSAICRSVNCDAQTVTGLAVGFKGALIDLLGPMLRGLVTVVLPKLLGQLNDLFCKIRLAIRNFLKKVMLAIFKILGKSPLGKPGSTTGAGTACGIAQPTNTASTGAKPNNFNCGNCFVAGTLVKTNADRTLIERMEVNDRVDPALPDGWDVAAVPLEGRYVDWRKLELVLLADNAPCGTATLLRPFAWVEDEGAVIGQTIFLNLPEIGIEGPAQVVSIEIVAVEPGLGRLATGVFRHQSGSILELKIEGENQPLGTTKSHPFWSVDREDWVSAQDLQPGELLLNDRNQPVRLVSITEHEEPQEVYNLEIDGDHCYRVGDLGLLVHNMSTQCCSGLKSDVTSPVFTVFANGRNVPIYGLPQNTGDMRCPGGMNMHAQTSINIAKAAAASGEYEYITLNRSWSKSSGNASSDSRRPDVVGVRCDGKVDAWEAISKTDNPNTLRDRVRSGMESLPLSRRGQIFVVPLYC